MKASHIIILIITITTINYCFSTHTVIKEARKLNLNWTNEADRIFYDPNLTSEEREQKSNEYYKKMSEVYYVPPVDPNLSVEEDVAKNQAFTRKKYSEKRKQEFYEKSGYNKMLKEKKENIGGYSPEVQLLWIRNAIINKNAEVSSIWSEKRLKEFYRHFELDNNEDYEIDAVLLENFRQKVIVAANMVAYTKNGKPADVITYLENFDSVKKEFGYENKSVKELYKKLENIHLPEHIATGKIVASILLIIISLIAIYFVK